MNDSDLTEIRAEIERGYQLACEEGFLGSRDEYDITIDEVQRIEDKTGFDFNNYWNTFRLVYRQWSEESEEE